MKVVFSFTATIRLHPQMPQPLRRQKDNDSSRHPYRGEAETSTTLLFRIKNGEPVAWSRFVDIYAPLIRHWCLRPGGRLSRGDRQDITQEVLAKAAHGITEFDEQREGRSFRAWLRTITRNTIADFFEKNEKRRDVSRLMSDTGHIKEPYSRFELPEEPNEKILILREVLKRVRPSISDKDWEIVGLFVNADKTSSEVAESMNMKPDTVRKIKGRVLKRIRDEYTILGIEDDLPDAI